jgi:hypothetical protein
MATATHHAKKNCETAEEENENVREINKNCY